MGVILRYQELSPALWIAGVSIALGALVGFWVYLKAHRQGLALRRASHVFLAGAVLVVVQITLAPRQSFDGVDAALMRGVNLVPFRSIASQFHGINPGLSNANLLGNLALFAPLGLLLPIAFPTFTAKACLLLGACLSCTIEFLQYWIGRSADIDDVIVNVAGLAIGIALARGALRMTAHRLHESTAQRPKRQLHRGT